MILLMQLIQLIQVYATKVRVDFKHLMYDAFHKRFRWSRQARAVGVAVISFNKKKPV